MANSPYRSQRRHRTPAGEKEGFMPRTYRLKVSTVADLEMYCEREGIYPSELVEVLVRNGLDWIAKGEITISRKPIMHRVDIT